MTTELILIVTAYLFGSLSSAVIVTHLMGQADPRSYGSKNPGATNVLRHGGKKAAAITLLGDTIKGVIPVLIGVWLDVPDSFLALIGAAAFLGHLYPVFFGFRGGKGVATALGVIIAISWPAGLMVLATWIMVAVISNISSLSALTAAVIAPAYMWWMTESPAFLAMTFFISTLLIIRHRSNISNLISGTEGKIRGP